MALFVLWLGYGVPHLLRHRHQLSEARSGDRFSGGMRVVAVGGRNSIFLAKQADSTILSRQSTSAQGGSMATRTAAAPGARPGVAVERPSELPVPSRFAVLEARARRAARARRRLVVTVLLLLASVAAWAFVALGTVHWGVAAGPTALLLLVLTLGRRAAVAARRADAMVAAARRAARQRATEARVLAGGGPHLPRNRLRVTGLAVHGSDADTQVIPRAERRPDVLDELLAPEPEPVKVVEVTPDGEVSPAAASVEEPVGGLAWNPVPVPLPTYVTKPPAPRREPVPMIAEEAPSDESTAVDDAALRAEDELLRGDVPQTKTETLAQPLEEILARRRAAG